jgi:hypothetical protein
VRKTLIVASCCVNGFGRNRVYGSFLGKDVCGEGDVDMPAALVCRCSLTENFIVSGPSGEMTSPFGGARTTADVCIGCIQELNPTDP